VTQNPISWLPSLSPAGPGPIYAAIVEAMAADIAEGRLTPGQRLPTHRALAAALDVDLTTVTRAYNEAQRRGLTEAVIGRGTYVRGAPPEAATAETAGPAPLDLGMNLPPRPPEAAFKDHLAAATRDILQRADLPALLSYRPDAGDLPDRVAGAEWLRPLLPEASADRVLVCGGAQPALLALLTTFARTGDLVLTEALTYPGFRALAGQLGVKLKGIAMDGEGILPEALDAACRSGSPKALYCIPTIQNPTTATMSMARRHAIAEILRKHQLPVFEDDAYGALPSAALPPLSALVPEFGYYAATFAKCIAPALRVGYLLVPGASQAARLTAAIRASTMMASPLTTAIATRWIGDGTAAKITAAIRRESAFRQRIATGILRGTDYAAHPEGHHLWLRLPAGWSGAEFANQARRWNLAAVPRSAFAVSGGEPEDAVRIALGAAPDRDQLAGALRLAADALAHPPEVMSSAG
jgi:DNA-binding transcriptional MocR family regulator